MFHQVEAPVELPGLFVFSHHGSHARRREKCGDARASRADAFRESALRDQLQLHLPFENHLLEQLILADVGANVLPDLPVRKQQSDAESVDARIIADGG